MTSGTKIIILEIGAQRFHYQFEKWCQLTSIRHQLLVIFLWKETFI